MFRKLWDFDRPFLTAEDKARAEYYRQNTERDHVHSSMLSLEEFLDSLDLKVDFAPLRSEDLARVAQLMQRVNQFNLNGAWPSPTDLQKLIPSRNCHTIRATDRFGDYGLIGMLSYRVSGKTLSIKSLALSCRALGKGVERRVGIHMVELARSATVTMIQFDYHATPKNDILRKFLLQLGVKEYAQGEHGITVDQLRTALDISDTSMSVVATVEHKQ